MSEVDDRGCGPNNFMSRAESHDVGGEGSEVCSDGGGDGSRASQEKWEGEQPGCLSLRTIRVVVKERDRVC